MDGQLIAQKLEALRYCITRVKDKCPNDAATLAADPDAQDIVALNLTRAVQQCVDIAAHIIAERNIPAPETMGQGFEQLAQTGVITPELATRMKHAVGFRNIAVHNYGAVNWQIVHAICKERLVDFEEFARSVARL